MKRGARQSGFSLIELAVVLVIVGLLVGGGIAALEATTEQTLRAEQRQQLEHAREALYGFSMSRGRLPCADTDSPPDGVENYDPGTGACEAGAGFGAFPWVTLGLGRRDAWGEPMYYATDPDWADAPGAGEESSFDLGATAALDVYDDVPTGTNLVAEDVPALVLSFGPQGGQIWLEGGRFDCGAATPAGFSDEERENCDDDLSFIDAGYRAASDTDGRFDDMLIWLPEAVLKARMVAAGRLP